VSTSRENGKHETGCPIDMDGLFPTALA